MAREPALTNEQVAAVLEETAELLQQQGANPFRVAAYRNGAETVREQLRPLEELLEEGPAALEQLPGIGRSLARAIEQLLHTGRFSLLERLRGSDRPERIFTTVADIGPKLARRIHETLEIETLADLEAAALDGRLARVPGMGRKRIQAVRESLAGRFRQRRPAAGESHVDETTPVAELLDIDEQYRRRAAQGTLHKIAPRRFNPTGVAWLPVLHTERGGRHYTALFSNTARAHEFGATGDWVVIYRDDQHDGQWTVITAKLGRLKGRRIVRGREQECAAYYDLA